MRNYRMLDEAEFRELERLYPTTTNRELSKMFNISIDAIQDRFAKVHGWKKSAAVKQGNRGGRTLDEKEVKWIVNHYQHTKNKDILEKFGIGESSLHRIARKYGLKKSRQFMKKVQAEVTAEAHKACETFGLYDDLAERMREECKRQYAAKEGVLYRTSFKPGESNKTRLSPKRFAETIQKIHEHRRQTIKSERRRLIFGMEQRTKMKLHINGYDDRQRKKSCHRHLFRRKGYIVERGSSTVYWNERTERSEQMEASAPLYGLEIKKQQ